MTNKQQEKLEQLQERALHLGLEIKNPDGTAIPEEVLHKNVQAAEEADKAKAEQAKAEQAKAKGDAEAKAKAEADAAARAGKDSEPPPAPVPPRPRRVSAKPEPQQVRAELVALCGLPKATEQDAELARHFGYPVIVPGGKPYVTSISFNCALGGKLREAGSVVILTDAHARNKLEFLTPVEEDDLPPRLRSHRQPEQNPPAKAAKK